MSYQNNITQPRKVKKAGTVVISGSVVSIVNETRVGGAECPCILSAQKIS